jgi:hypothetical protein
MRPHDPHVLSLESRQVARLGHVPGRRIECRAGTAWLTLDGDRRDIVLRPGESFLVDVDAPLLACALDGGPARIDLLEPAPRTRAERGMGSMRIVWSIAAVCAGFVSFGLFELWRALVDLTA